MANPNIWAPGSSTSSDNTVRSEAFIAAAGQRLFTFSSILYTPSTGSLYVSLGGLLQRPGIDFVETGPSSFTLAEGAPEDAIVFAFAFTSVVAEIPVVGATPSVFGANKLVATDATGTEFTAIDSTAYSLALLAAGSASTARGVLGLGSAAVETIGTGDDDVGLLSTVSDRIDAAIDAMPDKLPSVSGHDGETLIVESGAAAWGRAFKRRAVTSASGSSVSFTSLPNNVDYFKIVLSDVSPSATAVTHIRLGVSGSAVSSGYDSQRTYVEDPGTVAIAVETTSIGSMACTNATTKLRSTIEIFSVGSNMWLATQTGYRRGDARMAWSVGNITLSGTLDSLFVVLSTGTFAGGQIALYY